jgi:hypothetical protein
MSAVGLAALRRQRATALAQLERKVEVDGHLSTTDLIDLAVAELRVLRLEDPKKARELEEVSPWARVVGTAQPCR